MLTASARRNSWLAGSCRPAPVVSVNPRVCFGALKALSLLYLLLPASLAQVTADVTGAGIDFLHTVTGTSYVIKTGVVIAGSILDVVPSRTAAVDCAQACDALLGCSAFNWCGDQGGCWSSAAAASLAEGTCQLLMPEATMIVAVRELTSYAHITHVAGLRILIPNPGPLKGYVQFLGRSLNSEYDMPCNVTLFKGACVQAASIEDAKARCDSMPTCQGFAFAPNGLLNYTYPLANYKRSPSNGPLNFNDSSMSGLSLSYIKEGQLVQQPPAASSSNSQDASCGGLSAGAVTGIVAGASGAAAAIIAGFAIGRRRRRQLAVKGAQKREPNSPSRSSSRSKSIGGVNGGLSGLDIGRGSEVDLALDSKSMPESPLSGLASKVGPLFNPSQDIMASPGQVGWEDVLIRREAIELCRNSKGNPIKLGAGASGEVYQAQIYGSTTCAVKVFNFGSNNNAPKRFLKEVSMLWRINSGVCHPGLVQFLGASLVGDKGLLVLEFMPGGDLESRINDELPDGRGRLFAWKHKGRRAALQVAVALQHLHKHRFIHLDIKPSNVLLTREGHCKLGDVGLARFMGTSKPNTLSGGFGTFNWCAPEVLLGGAATVKADIYSYGVLLYELCSGEPPHRGFLRKLEAPRECPSEVAELQLRCVSSDPLQRPSADEIVEVLRGCIQGERPRGDFDIQGSSGRPTPTESAALDHALPSAHSAAAASTGVSGAITSAVSAPVEGVPANGDSSPPDTVQFSVQKRCVIPPAPWQQVSPLVCALPAPGDGQEQQVANPALRAGGGAWSGAWPEGRQVNPLPACEECSGAESGS